MLILLSTLISGCVTSPAPGCSFYLIPGPTGCFSKTAITDVSINPQKSCLTVNSNNCQGGDLYIDNHCNIEFVIEGNHIATNDGAFIEPHHFLEGNNQVISGKLGSEVINIKYSKRRYCN